MTLRAARRSGSRLRALFAGAAIALTVSACGGGGAVAPLGRAGAGATPSTRGVHVVSPGDTVYAIAWRYGLDYRDLARWNGVGEPFRIRPGQTLRLTRPAVLPPVATTTTPAPPTRSDTPRTSSRPPAARSPVPRRTAPAPAKETQRAVTSWLWPAKGEITGRFGGSGGKGIDIEGRAGSPVIASAPGRVVYSGSGLRGYGKLIIVKHNKRYLSAYAHNERLHVKEGDTVSSGQRIADMGSTGTKTVKLHFEIRRDGKPVDPTRYLPR